LQSGSQSGNGYPESSDWRKAEIRGSLFGVVRGVMHHISNALTPVLGNAQLLLQQARGEKDILMLQQIVERSLEATQLVRRLQELYAPTTGADRQQVEINALIRQIVETTEPWWKDELRRDGRSVDVRADLQELSPVTADLPALREALLQLLLNAVEAIPGQGHVEIKTEQAGDEARIMFMDNGVGIPEHIQRRIFDPFVTTKGAGRAGLGLTTVQAVIADHGGRVEVFSREGTGTTVVISLPKAPSCAAKSDTVDITGGSATGAALPALDVLVIEDEEPVRQLLAKVLENEGQRVTTVASGPEGLIAFRRGNFPLVFTDWGMESLSGLQVAQKIKELSPTTRVILVTGWGTQLDQRRASDWCVDAILAKPFTIEQVRRRIEEVLRGRGATEASR
jgi:CheY-like chemotaxis protein/two-component sensor histidine kinase